MKIIFALTIALGFVLVSTNAYACRCVAPSHETAQKVYNEADIVLRVKPTEFSKGWNASGPLITFDILEVYKTNQELNGTITAKNNPVTAACGNYIAPDTEYVLGFWDLQITGYEVKNAVGYRVMHSCAQSGVQHYIENNYHKNMKDE